MTQVQEVRLRWFKNHSRNNMLGLLSSNFLLGRSYTSLKSSGKFCIVDLVNPKACVRSVLRKPARFSATKVNSDTLKLDLSRVTAPLGGPVTSGWQPHLQHLCCSCPG